MSLKQEAFIHRDYRHRRYANLKHQSNNQGTGRPEGPAGNTPTEMLLVDYRVHTRIFVHYYQHYTTQSRKRPKASNEIILTPVITLLSFIQ